jgi:hypothetical protein
MSMTRFVTVCVLTLAAAPALAMEEAELKDASGKVIVPYAIETPAAMPPAGTTDPAKQLGLFVCFHEHNRKAPEEAQIVVESLKRLNLADGYVVIGMQDGTPHGYSMVDDHERAVKLIAWAKKTYPINPRRVYLWGRGEGAKMAGEFSTEHPDLIAGIITYSWGFWKLATVKDPALNIPDFYVVLGLKDLPHHLWTVREAYARVKGLGYNVIYREVEGLGGPTKHPVVNDDSILWATRLRHKTLPLSPQETALLKPYQSKAAAQAMRPDPAVFKALVTVGGRAAGNVLAMALEAKDDKTRALAAQAWNEGNFGPAAAEALAKRLKDPSAEVRAAAIKALGVAAGWRMAAAQEALVRTVSDKAWDATERRAAVDALGVAVKMQVRGSYQDLPMFSALIPLLDDDDADVRKKTWTVVGPILMVAYRPEYPKPQREAVVARLHAWLEAVRPREPS